MKTVIFFLSLVAFTTTAFGQVAGTDKEKAANDLAGDRMLQLIDRQEFCKKASPIEAELRSQGKTAKNTIQLRGFFNLFNKVEKCPRLENI